jgi:signal peptidase I
MSGEDRQRPEDELAVAPVDDEFEPPRRRPAPRARPLHLDLQARDRTEDAVARHAVPAGLSAPAELTPTTGHRPPPSVSLLRAYFEAAIITLLIWLFGMTFIVQPVAVPTGSMENTILVGDHLLVNRSIYGARGASWSWLLPYRDVRRGDIIVFKHPRHPESYYVKRVVGLPGETVEIYGSRVYIDGRELAETRWLSREASGGRLETVGDPMVSEGAEYSVYYNQLRDLGDAQDTEFASLVSADRGTIAVGKPYTVPADQFFCLGDNRDSSEDSRQWGTVPRDNLVGRAMLVYWSVDRPAEQPLGIADLFTATRWARTGAFIH